MIIGLVKENHSGQNRFALVPGAVIRPPAAAACRRIAQGVSFSRCRACASMAASLNHQ
jgi:hypothetical protein